MIEVSNLTKKFGNFTALDDVSFRAEKGEIITLLGPNGAGKSTLMRCICGYLISDKGKVLIDGIDLHDNLIKVLKNIGYMPENTPLYPEMKVAEYLQFIAGIYKMTSADFKKNLEVVMSELDLQSVAEQKIGTLSKGYKRRAGLAAVILHKPSILILDEPTEGLDPNQKFSLRQFLKKYAENALVLISTHLLEEAEALDSRILLLNHGKLAEDTTVKHFKEIAPHGDLAQLFYNLTNNGAADVE